MMKEEPAKASGRRAYSRAFSTIYLHITSKLRNSCNGLSISFLMTMLSASHLIMAAFSNRVAVNII